MMITTNRLFEGIQLIVCKSSSSSSRSSHNTY